VALAEWGHATPDTRAAEDCRSQDAARSGKRPGSSPVLECASPLALFVWLTTEAVKEFDGRDTQLRVPDGKPKTDAEHRVPTESDLRAQTNYFTAPPDPDGKTTQLVYL
jgi:hypothetical protein